MRYLDLTLAAYVGESVIVRYDPRDMAEIRVFHDHRILLANPDFGSNRLMVKV
jgi:putative transposase